MINSPVSNPNQLFTPFKPLSIVHPSDIANWYHNKARPSCFSVQLGARVKQDNNNNNNNMYLKSSIQTSSIDHIKENIHITLNISSNIPIQ